MAVVSSLFGRVVVARWSVDVFFSFLVEVVRAVGVAFSCW